MIDHHMKLSSPMIKHTTTKDEIVNYIGHITNIKDCVMYDILHNYEKYGMGHFNIQALYKIYYELKRRINFLNLILKIKKLGA